MEQTVMCDKPKLANMANEITIKWDLYFPAVDAQGRGLLYSGIVDCARKITRSEGLPAFYKGMGPSYLRQAPHTVLLLVFWDMLKDAQKAWDAPA